MLCPDCPDLSAERMPADWTPRPMCCRDEQIQRRLEGSQDSFPGIVEARLRWDHPENIKLAQAIGPGKLTAEELARIMEPPEPGNRVQRRASAAKKRRAK